MSVPTRGVSLAGKAPVSHTGDHRFESGTLHHQKHDREDGTPVFLWSTIEL